MKKPALLILVAAAAFFSFSCKPDVSDEQDTQPEIFENLAYGTDPLQTADVYVPAGGGNGYGAVIVIHGGSWCGGDKVDLHGLYPQKLVENGYVTVLMNYRLADAKAPETNTVIIRDMLDDIDAVKVFINNKADEWGCARNKFALVGASAGGHLALMDTLTRNGGKTIKACASFSGPTDFTDPDFQDNIGDADGNTVVQGLELATGTKWNGTDPASVSAFEAVSPLHQDLASQAAVSFVLVHGALDTLVPVAQAEAMKAALDAAKVPVDWYRSAIDGHLLTSCVFTALDSTLLPVLARTLR